MPSQTRRATFAVPGSARSVVAALAALALTACTSQAPAPIAPATGRTAAAEAAPSLTTADVTPEQWAEARQQATSALLGLRLAAAERGDEAAWLAPLGGSSAVGLRRTQAAVLHRMSAIGVEDLRLTGVRETTAPVAAARGTSVEWDVRVGLTYRIRGFDTEPRAFDLHLTLKADPGDPSRLTVTASSPSGRPQPWDLDGLRVRRSPTALVLVVGDASRVDEVLRRARTAADRVAEVWGSARPAVWVAPASDADAGRLLGRSPAADGLGGVAAATDGPLTPGERAGADRIVLVPRAWTSLRGDGRDVVMTHELTHVTVRGSTTRSVPVWLSEGFAELVAYTHVNLPEAAVVAPALERVRATGLPSSLPADADFDPGTQTLPAAYGLSLLALRTLADTYGTRAVVELYRAAAGGLAVPTDRLDDREGVVDEALRGAVGATRAQLLGAWRDRLRALLG